MKKIVFGAVLVLVVTIGFSVYYVLSNLDTLVKTAIETYGSQATQTAVRVEEVQIGLRDGSAAILGLTVANPQGFAELQAFSLGEIAAQIDLESLSGEAIVIEYLNVKSPEVFFELNQAGKINLEELSRNITSGASGSSASGQGGGEEQRFIVRRLLFTDGNIHAKVVPVNKSYELKLPTIEMQNLGGKSGATPAQLANKVLNLLTDRAMAEVKKKGIDRYKVQLESEVNKRIEAEQQKAGAKVSDKLQGLLNNR